MDGPCPGARQPSLWAWPAVRRYHSHAVVCWGPRLLTFLGQELDPKHRGGWPQKGTRDLRVWTFALSLFPVRGRVRSTAFGVFSRCSLHWSTCKQRLTFQVTERGISVKWLCSASQWSGWL